MHVRHQEVPRLIHLIGIENPVRASVRRSNVQVVMRMPMVTQNWCPRRLHRGPAQTNPKKKQIISVCKSRERIDLSEWT
jgi:hypothetical protein